MRRKKTLSLSEAIREYRREMKIDNKLKEVEILNYWEEIAGKAILRRTSRVYIKNGVMFINLSSSVVRSELMMIRETIRERLNEKAGEELIKEIILK
jgi:hypothetical protein